MRRPDVGLAVAHERAPAQGVMEAVARAHQQPKVIVHHIHAAQKAQPSHHIVILGHEGQEVAVVPVLREVGIFHDRREAPLRGLGGEVQHVQLTGELVAGDAVRSEDRLLLGEPLHVGHNHQGMVHGDDAEVQPVEGRVAADQLGEAAVVFAQDRGVGHDFVDGDAKVLKEVTKLAFDAFDGPDGALGFHGVLEDGLHLFGLGEEGGEVLLHG